MTFLRLAFNGFASFFRFPTTTSSSSSSAAPPDDLRPFGLCHYFSFYSENFSLSYCFMPYFLDTLGFYSTTSNHTTPHHFHSKEERMPLLRVSLCGTVQLSDSYRFELGFCGKRHGGSDLLQLAVRSVPGGFEWFTACVHKQIY